MPRLGSPPYLIRNGTASMRISSPRRAATPALLVLDDAPPGRSSRPTDPAAAEARRAVESGKYDVALYFPADFAPAAGGLSTGRRAHAGQRRRRQTPATGARPKRRRRSPVREIIYTTANERSQIARDRLSAVLERWTEEVGKSNLAAGGVPAGRRPAVRAWRARTWPRTPPTAGRPSGRRSCR